MKYGNTFEAVFVDRPNRFIAHVNIDGIIETVHVKNTGRCRELLIPGVSVILEKSDNPERKTKYDLICVKKDGLGWVNIDSQVPNKVVLEWLQKGGIKDITYIKPEYSYGNSRIDFYVECGSRKLLIEVKGCTLEIDGKGYFPDAPTERGVKHLNELANAVQFGYECYLAYVIAMPGVTCVFPNGNTDPEYLKAFLNATNSGVKPLFLRCEVKPDEINIINEKEL